MWQTSGLNTNNEIPGSSDNYDHALSLLNPDSNPAMHTKFPAEFSFLSRGTFFTGELRLCHFRNLHP